MAQLNLKSQRQIQIDLLSPLISELGLNDVNPGSVIDILTNAVAQEDFAQYVQMAQISRLNDLNSITGSDLDLKAFEYGLTRRLAQKATGIIDILRPVGFTKVSTTFYAGAPAPISGDSNIDVNDASSPLIGTSGTLILGRGTSNEEEVSYSSAPVDNSNFFRFTLDTPLSNDHAIEETIILKQGNDETIIAGTQVRVASTGTSSEITFTINNDVILLSGESRVSGVNITAVEAGAKGNIAVKDIEGEDAFVTAPFAGARAENTQKFTTGRNRELDDELRDRIRRSVQSLSRGVKQAIQNAVVGLVDPISAKRVVSANIILPQDECGPVKIYIDDGSGFEPSFLSRGFETAIGIATGGETRIITDIAPVVKAQIESNIAEPYNFSGGSKTFIVDVGIRSETITFVNSDFQFVDSATAEEVVTAINDKSALLEARTTNNGTKVNIIAKSDTNEDIQVTGGSANSILGFPTDKRSTLYLYINDEIKSKDGQTALIDSGNQGPYNLQTVGAFPHTLTLVIDGKTANPQTVTFQSSDFVDTTSCTPNEMVTVINQQLVGSVATLANNNTQVRLTSNTLLSSKSSIQITGGSANDATNGLNFSTALISGVDGDYTFNKETGTIELKEALLANDIVTFGSVFTRAKLRASIGENYSPANGETLVFSVDKASDQTVTFDNSFAAGKSAQGTADYINQYLEGATAIARTVGNQTFLEVSTNTLKEADGFLEIKSSSTANSTFGFELDTEVFNQRPHSAFVESGSVGPYSFREGDSLVAIIDDDIVNNTFSVIFDYDGSVSSGVNTTQFAISTFSNVFELDDELIDYDVAFTTGANTRSGTILSTSDQGGNTWRLLFDSLPTNLADISVNDLVKLESFNTTGNNGFFIITAVNTVGNGYIEITNPNGAVENGISATATMSQKRTVTDYVSASGLITVGSAFSTTPSASDNAIVLPTTIKNVVNYMNNTKISSLSLKSNIRGVQQNTKIQVASKRNGSDGYVQITGGRANELLNFNTSIIRGLQGYNYYTGLLELVHRTIYGDDSDLVSFPGIGAAGITFQVLAPTVREVSISINVTLREGISLNSVETEIKSAITGYINNLGVGDDIILEEIKARVIRISGITDVVLNLPLANIAIADNEIGRTRDSLILVG